jgi:outer membrane protein assembly factor BamB
MMRRHRRLLIALGALLILALAASALGYNYVNSRTGSVYNANAPFVTQTSPAPLPAKHASFSWPVYGYTTNHTRFFPASSKVRPPFRVVWEHPGTSLLEFPPVIRDERIFQLADDGTLRAINKNTGHDFWYQRLGTLSASTPAVVGDRVYATIMDRTQGLEQGRAVALDYNTGRIIWSRDLPSQSESSPMYWQGKVYFGSQNGTVYALNAATGQTVWTYKAEGAVKASPTLQNGILYFGDYSGHLQAVSARTGHRLWLAGSEGALIGSGNFYSTPAVMYGRVFLGNTDGRVYAYDARNGALAWAVQTGAYVYSSPAVTNAPGIGPTVFIGSYDGNLYAINAHTGAVSWRYDAGGKISGSPTIIGRILYFADLGSHSTYGLDISTGHVVYHIDQGAFDPVISDGHDIFLSGYGALFLMEPMDESSSHH